MHFDLIEYGIAPLLPLCLQGEKGPRWLPGLIYHVNSGVIIIIIMFAVKESIEMFKTQKMVQLYKLHVF